MIEDRFEPRQIPITLTEYQLAAAVEATHDALIRRIKWTVTRDPAWSRADWGIVRESISQLTEAYTQFMFALRDLPTEAFHPEFFTEFAVPADMWELANGIIYGDTWDAAPVHPHQPGHPSRPACGLCDLFEQA